MKLADMGINMQFGGRCPICNGNNTLAGSFSKRHVKCNACGSKFEGRFGFGSPKYKLIEGDSEYLGKELTLKEWKEVRVDILLKNDIIPDHELEETISEDAKEKICGIFAVYQTAFIGGNHRILVTTTNRIIVINPISTAADAAGAFFLLRGAVDTYASVKRDNLKNILLKLKSDNITTLNKLLAEYKHSEYFNDAIKKVTLTHIKMIFSAAINIYIKNSLYNFKVAEKIPFENIRLVAE
jgi:hypothetical protein